MQLNKSKTNNKNNNLHSKNSNNDYFEMIDTLNDRSNMFTELFDKKKNSLNEGSSNVKYDSLNFDQSVA